MKCILCNKEFSSTSYLTKHYTKKLPCIQDKDKWLKNKNIYEPDDSPIFFNKEQLEFINSPLKDLKLIGIPGGGKTRCIIEKINNHFVKGDYIENNNFMILSFSKRCRFDFINKGKIYPKRFDKNNVKTLHSLSKTIVNLFTEKNTSSLETIIIAAKYALENIEEQEVKKYSIFNNLKTIYLDEAQDISESQFNLILLLKKITNCNLVMVGDPNQNIYQFQGGSDKFLLEYNVDTIYLKQNYRSSSNIVNFVNSISPNKENLMVSSNDKTDKKVQIYIENLENINKYILEEIDNYDGDLSQIAIIGPVRKCKPINEQYLNLGLSNILNLFEKNNIKYCKFFDDTNDNTFKHDDKIKFKPNHINLLTIHGSKGLEFDKVILLNFHFFTFGITPTIEDFNRFKYLWYVGCSRAKTEMSLICYKDKMIWPLLEYVSSNIYKCNTLIKFKSLFFKPQKKQFNYGITKLLQEITPDDLYKFENIIDYETSFEQFNFGNQNDIVNFNDFSALYGLYIEKCFQYFYTRKFYKKDNNIFSTYLNKIITSIQVPKKYVANVISLIKRLNYELTDTFTLSKFNSYKNRFTKNQLSAYNYLLNKIKSLTKQFTLIFDSDIISNDIEGIKQICNTMIENYNHPDYYKNIFLIVLYSYQINHELGYLWDKDFNKEIDSLKFYVNQIEEFVEKVESDMEFSINTSHPNLPIIGEIDILENKETIIDIKFTKNIYIKQVIQLLLYYNNMFPDWNQPKKLKIFNFYQSRVYNITINKNLSNYDILKILSDITNEKIKNCIFVYDLETTSLEIENCFIIERFFKEYNLGFTASKGIININTKIPIFIENLTGITNNMISNGGSYQNFKKEIEDIFKYCEYPKFIAHNGTAFDHRIMLRYNLFTNILKNQLLDSKNIIRMMVNTDNLKLSYLYNTLIKNPNIKNYHRAEADVEMLISVLKHLRYS